MATVTGYTAARMQEIEDGAIVGGEIQGDDLVLLRRDGVEIVAGPVVGPQGPVGPEGGVSDHGDLTGLADDDHPQYHNDARGDARYPLIAAATKKATGTYTGDGTASRTIALPFTPILVIISYDEYNGGAIHLFGPAGVAGNGVIVSPPGTYHPHLNVGLTTNGFIVTLEGDPLSGNDIVLYKYLAIG